MKKKKVIAGVVLVAVIAAGGSGVVVWKKVQDGTLELSFLKKSDKTEGSVYVDSVEKILNPDVSGTNQRFSGVIEPQKTWKIEASSDKKIKEIYVAEGDQVKAGQDLFTYDTSEAEENLVDAQIELDRLNSDIETTQKQIDTMNKELANVKDEDQRLEYTNLIQTKENSLKKSQSRSHEKTERHYRAVEKYDCERHRAVRDGRYCQEYQRGCRQFFIWIQQQ